MTTLNDKASGSQEVFLARDSHGAYRLEDDELTDASAIGDDFPKYGDFLEVTPVTRSGQPKDDSGETAWLECPQNLAAGLVEAGKEPGDLFIVRNAAKDMDGNWTFEVEDLDTDA